MDHEDSKMGCARNGLMADLNNFAQAMNAGFSCIFDCKLMSSAGIW
jgi:predicted RNA-binding protein with PIN domain